jgi:hypothetical protein
MPRHPAQIYRGAADLLVNEALEKNQSVRDLCAARFKDFQFGLKLITQNSGGVREFQIDADTVQQPEKVLSEWVVASYRAPARPRGATVASTVRTIDVGRPAADRTQNMGLALCTSCKATPHGSRSIMNLIARFGGCKIIHNRRAGFDEAVAIAHRIFGNEGQVQKQWIDLRVIRNRCFRVAIDFQHHRLFVIEQETTVCRRAAAAGDRAPQILDVPIRHGLRIADLQRKNVDLHRPSLNETIAAGDFKIAGGGDRKFMIYVYDLATQETET